MLNANAWRGRCSAGYHDDLLVIGDGFRDQKELEAILTPYGLAHVAVALECEAEDIDPRDATEPSWEAIGIAANKWYRSKHADAIPALTWSSLVPDAEYSSDGWWWVGVEAPGDSRGEHTPILLQLLPGRFGAQAASWAEVLACLRKTPGDDDDHNEHANAMMAIVLARWLCGFDAASGNSFYRFSATEAFEVAGVDPLRLGFEAGRLRIGELEAAFDGQVELDHGLVAATLLECVKARTGQLRDSLSRSFGGDSALLWSLHSTIWPNFEQPAWDYCDDFVNLRSSQAGDLEHAWAFVHYGWAENVET